WYTDRVDGGMPSVWVLSLPMWIWRVVMLAWALWLALRVIGWAKWAWRCWSGGGVWKRLIPPPRRRAPGVAVAGAGVAPGATGAASPDGAAAPADPTPPSEPSPAPSSEAESDRPSEGADEPPEEPKAD